MLLGLNGRLVQSPIRQSRMPASVLARAALDARIFGRFGETADENVLRRAAVEHAATAIVHPLRPSGLLRFGRFGRH